LIKVVEISAMLLKLATGEMLLLISEGSETQKASIKLLSEDVFMEVGDQIMNHKPENL
jgi:hypothetical protein